MKLNIPLRLRDKAILMIKDSKRTRIFKFHNLILDAGLANLGLYDLPTLITSFGIIKSSVGIDVGNVETDFCGPLQTTACGGGQQGISEWWQNSYIQAAISTTDAGDNATLDHTYATFTRHWEISNTEFVNMTLSHTSGKDGLGNPFAVGGSLVDLTDMILARQIYTFESGPPAGGLDYPCRNPGDPAGHAAFDQQVLNNIWNRIQFKDDLGNPTTITIDSSSIIHLDYTLTLDVASTPDVQTITIDGVSTTVTTRCYEPLARWNVADVFNWSALNAIAWDNNAMPLIDMWQTGSTAIIDVKLTITNYPKEVKYLWGAAKANWVGGIGSITHGPGQFLITTFSPKIAKTNLQNFVFQPVYHWARVGGD